VVVSLEPKKPWELEEYWKLQQKLLEAQKRICSNCVNRANCFPTPHATYSIKEIQKKCNKGVEEIIDDLESLKQRT